MTVQRYAFSAVLLAGASLALSACGSISPQYAVRPGGGYSAAPPPPHSGMAGVRGTEKPYQINGQWYYPAVQPNYNEVGMASWYGDAFNGKPTADGEIFDMYGLSAAHKTLPLPSMVEVTNLDNGRSMQVRVNDRGPFVGDRLIDLSRGAAEQLGVLKPGLARVRVRYVGPAITQPLAQTQIARAPITQPLITQTPIAPPSAPLQQYASAQIQPTHIAATPGQTYQVQAGAFSDRANAERVADTLADAGVVEIQPVDRGGVTLYRVMVREIADETEAGAVRDKVVNIGLTDARIINPF